MSLLLALLRVCAVHLQLIYEAVLVAHTAVIAGMRPGVSWPVRISLSLTVPGKGNPELASLKHAVIKVSSDGEPLR